MKFLVLCTFELRRADERVRQAALAELVAAGFKPVGGENVGGLRFGLANCALGEFRAPANGLLERRIENDLKLRFASRGIEARFTVCANPLPAAQDARDSMAM